MTRLETTPAILGILVGGMFAAELLTGCSSKQVEIGLQNMDAHPSVLDAHAGNGGTAGTGIDAAVAGSGDAAGGVTAAGGSVGNGGTVASGGAPPSGGSTGVGSGGSSGAGGSKLTTSGGTSASGGTTRSGGTIASGGTTAIGTGCAPDWTLCCGQCLSPFAGVCQTPCPAGGGGATGGATGTGGAGGSTGAKCGGLAGLPCAVGEICEMPPGAPSDGFGTCVVNPPTPDAAADSAGGDGGSIGLPCAGERGDTCPVNQLCDLFAGNCGASDGGGRCVAKPQACSDIYQPVCGCNGMTYPNDCVRQFAGASKDHDGECGGATTCGGIAGASCTTVQFCEIPAGSCNVSDATGTCVAKYTNCLTNSQPECGCDGKTYRNSCYREAAGVSKKSGGACPTADAAVARDASRDSAAVLLTRTLPAACTTDADCCVSMDDCVYAAYLVGKAEFNAMNDSIANVNQGRTMCASCLPYPVQVQCQTGFCVGQKLNLNFTTVMPLTYSHCGYINVTDAGAVTAPTTHSDPDAAVVPARTAWSCSG